MLYTLMDMRRAAMQPMHVLASATRATCSNPFVPVSWTRLGRSMVAAIDVMDGVFRRRGKPEWGLPETEIDGSRVPVIEEIVYSEPFCDLLHFRRKGRPDGTDPKILLVAPMSGHFATLLRGTVEALLPNHEVYVTDWRDAKHIPADAGHFGFDDYVASLISMMRLLGPDINVMAVCQPVPAVVCAVSLLAAWNDPAQPASMILMGGPLDTRQAETEVTRFAEQHSLASFERSVITRIPAYHQGAGRRVYPGFLQLGAFMSMNASRHMDAHLRYFNHLVEGDGDSAEAHETFYDEYLAVMDTPAEFYLETIDRVFHRHLLPRGEMVWKGQKVDPAAIRRTALMTVEGEKDDISAPGQTAIAHDLCASIPEDKKRHLLQPSVGHYGIFNGRRWRQEICPAIASFIREQQTAEPCFASQKPEGLLPRLGRSIRLPGLASLRNRRKEPSA